MNIENTTMQSPTTDLIKKTKQHIATIFFCTIIMSLSFVDSVQGEEAEYSGENNEHFIDTVTSGMYRVIRNYSSEINHYIGTRAGIEEELVLDFEKDSKDEVVSLGSVTFTNSWVGYDDPVADLADIEIKISKDRFLLTENSSSGESSIEFATRHDSLVILPDLLKML